MISESREYDHMYDPIFMESIGGQVLRRHGNATIAQIRGPDRYMFFSQCKQQEFHPPTHYIMLDDNKTSKNENRQSQNSLQTATTRSNPRSFKMSTAHSYKSHQFTDAQPTSKTIGVQTDYRDSEAQTDPYSPPVCIINNDTNNSSDTTEPLLLKLKHLKFSNNTLPVGYDEVEALERQVIKEQILKALPNGNDKQSLKVRRIILSEIEASDWDYKEMLMKREQNLRLEQIMKEMKKRDQIKQKIAEDRLNQIRLSLHENQQQLADKIHQKKIKQLRKLQTKQQAIQNIIHNISRSTFDTTTDEDHAQKYDPNFTNMNTRKNNFRRSNSKMGNIVNKYWDYSSEIYAPTKYKGAEQNTIHNATTDLLKTIRHSSVAVQTSIHKQAMNEAIEKLNTGIEQEKERYTRLSVQYQKNGNARVSISTETTENMIIDEENDDKKVDLEMKIILATKRYSTRAGQRIMEHLDHMNSMFKDTFDEEKPNTTDNQKNKRMKFENIYKTFNPIVRPPTPQIDGAIYNANKMDYNQAITLIQSLIRGRAMQNKMYEGKEKRLELIQELQIEEKQRAMKEEKEKSEEDSSKNNSNLLKNSAFFQQIAPILKQVIANSLKLIE